MKTLLILRHAKSSWKNQDLDDRDRPLNKRGKRDAPRMGALLREHDLVPDLILSSTAERARKTAEAVAESSGYQNEVELSPNLYHAGPQMYRDVLRQLSDDYESVMVVGHNPGLEIFLENLTGECELLPTAAMAYVNLEIDCWSELDLNANAELVSLWRPRELT